MYAYFGRNIKRTTQLLGFVLISGSLILIVTLVKNVEDLRTVGKFAHLDDNFLSTTKKWSAMNTRMYTPFEVKFEPSRSIFIFSALFFPDKDWKRFSSVVLITMDNLKGTKDVKCCFLYKNYKTQEVIFTKLNVLLRFEYWLRQIYCKIPTSELPLKVAIVRKQDKCSMDAQFINILQPQREPEKFAVCTKIIYGKLDPLKLITWFEYYRMMGVDQVFTFVSQLDTESRKVIAYYTNQGLVTAFPFLLLDQSKNRTRLKKTLGKEQFINSYTPIESQTTLKICEILMMGYKYAAALDFDEFIVIKKHISLKQYLFNIMAKSNNTGVLRFLPEYFISDWGTMRNHSLHVLSYLNRTKPLTVCQKNIYMPSRTRLAALKTHWIMPSPKYYVYKVPTGEATIHHYRRCLSDWGRSCLKIKRFTDHEMDRYDEQLTERAIRVKNKYSSSVYK